MMMNNKGIYRTILKVIIVAVQVVYWITVVAIDMLLLFPISTGSIVATCLSTLAALLIYDMAIRMY